MSAKPFSIVRSIGSCGCKWQRIIRSASMGVRSTVCSLVVIRFSVPLGQVSKVRTDTLLDLNQQIQTAEYAEYAKENELNTFIRCEYSTPFPICASSAWFAYFAVPSADQVVPRSHFLKCSADAQRDVLVETGAVNGEPAPGVVNKSRRFPFAGRGV